MSSEKINSKLNMKTRNPLESGYSYPSGVGQPEGSPFLYKDGLIKVHQETTKNIETDNLVDWSFSSFFYKKTSSNLALTFFNLKVKTIYILIENTPAIS